MDKRIIQTLALGAVLLALLLALVDTGTGVRRAGAPRTGPLGAGAPAWAAAVEAGRDHVAPEALADLLLAHPERVLIVDVRPAEDHARFGLPGSVNLDLVALLGPRGTALLDAHADRTVVLVSNGMTHPAQAWVALTQAGRTNVRILEDGIDGFVGRMLTPPSLRVGTTQGRARQEADRFAALRGLVLGGQARPGDAAPAAARHATDPDRLSRPTVVSTDWVARRADAIVLLDTRPDAADYAAGHLPGAVHATVAATRETRGGVADEMLPPEQLAAVVGAWGIGPDTEVVAYGGDRLQDATHLVLSLMALGHTRVAVMEGGLGAWRAEGRALSTDAPTPVAVPYAARPGAFDFGVTIDDVIAASAAGGKPPILDVRPKASFEGEQGKEVRGGRIPGSIGRPYTADVATSDGGVYWRPTEALRDAYAALGLAPEAPVIVSCRTGHQASQTWFTLRVLLGYPGARWYDGSWKEWSLRPDLPAETGPATHPRAP